MERDYSAEVAELIEKWTRDQAGYNARTVAREIIEHLNETDTDLMAGWLSTQAENFLYEEIRRRDRSARSYARSTASRGAFAKAAAAASNADSEPLEQFMNLRYVVDVTNTRKRLADMRHDDLVFVGSEYRRRATENAFHAKVFEMLADKVKDGSVADHYTEQQLANMFRSF